MRYWKSIYSEEAISINSISDKAIYIWKDNSFNNCILFCVYDPKPFYEKDLNKITIEESILGFVDFGNSEYIPNVSYTINRMGAKPGLKIGPTLYDITLAMAKKKNKFLCSDRISVSNQAMKVWEYFFKKRSDVEKVKIDDSLDMITPQTWDDGDLYRNIDDNNYETRHFINYMYRAKNPINYSALVKNNSNLEFEYIKKKSLKQFQDFLETNSQLFFDNVLFVNSLM